MNTIDYIKKTLQLTHVSMSIIPQHDDTNIIMEKCELNGREVVLVYELIHDENTDKAVITC